MPPPAQAEDRSAFWHQRTSLARGRGVRERDHRTRRRDQRLLSVRVHAAGPARAQYRPLPWRVATSSGAALLNAVVVGYELTCRIPKTLGVSNLRDRLGLANHGVGPVFGAAAAAASIMRLEERRIPDLLSYCAQQASGSWQWLLDVDHVEKAFVFAGMPARNGLQAALMVEAGFTGVPNCLDVPGGWLMSGMFNGPESDLN